MRRLQRSFLAVLFVLVMALATTPGSGCGPDFPQAVYTGRRAPDAPIDNYAGGKLGIVQPTYARRYLIVAYDILNARPLTASEQAGFTGERKLSADQDLQIAFAHWREARKQIVDDSRLGDTPDVDRLITGQQYQSYRNCLPDAFETAARTLNARIAAHRTDPGDLQHWVSGQDIVFQNCKTGSAIPASLGNVPRWLQQDRAYQTASAFFYSADFRNARLSYSAIAADSASPWVMAANYLVARTYLREATLRAGKPDMALLRMAQQHLEGLLRSKRAGAYASSARGLLNYIRFRTEPAAQAIALEKELSTPAEDSRFGQDVTDLTLLLDRAGPDETARRQSELIDWIATMQSTGTSDADHALERWHATKKELWLVAALTTAPPESTAAKDLIDAAKLVPASSSAFASAAYHRAVLLNAAHRSDEVRAQLDEMLPDAQTSQPPSTVNALLHERMMAADTLPDFFAHLVRRPVKYGLSSGNAELVDASDDATLANTLCAADQKESNEERALRFDEGGAALLNQRIPLAQIEAGIENEPMPSHLRFELALAAWTRAALLGDTAIADHLVSRLSACDPRLRPFLMAYREAKSAEAKRFAAVYTLLNFPGLQPFVATNLARATDLEKLDEYRRNWWCAEDAAVAMDPRAPPITPPFLTASEVAQAKKEQADLRQDDPAPRYLALQSVEWAKANHTDPRSPQALALSLRATRYGCGTASDGGVAGKAAFDLLHAQYPNSMWAKKYPYWFKD